MPEPATNKETFYMTVSKKGVTLMHHVWTVGSIRTHRYTDKYTAFFLEYIVNNIFVWVDIWYPISLNFLEDIIIHFSVILDYV